MGKESVVVNDGDTAWILISSALVFLMTPGLAFFYGGLVHGDNVIHTMMMSLVCIAIISVLWLIIGYSLSFAPGNAYIGYSDFAGLRGVYQTPNPDYVATVPHYAFMGYQLMFAIITPALISGSIVGRMRFKAYLLFLIMWSLLVYDPVCHWVWSAWTTSDGVQHFGWLRKLGALDFAGGTVVHIISGVSGPVIALFLGYRKKREDFVPHNIPFVLLGAGLLWFGWFGFNAGSALQSGGLATLAFTNTHMAASSGFCTWMTWELLLHKPSSVGGVTGAVIGLVGITPAAGFVEPWAAIIIGIVTVSICFGVLQLKKKYKDHGYLAFLDDSLDVFCCHGVGGICGALLTGLFATTRVNPYGNDGAFYGNGKLFGIQLCAVVTTASYAIVVTSIIMLLLKYTIGIRVSEQKEQLGLDKAVHGERAYASARNVLQKIVSNQKFFPVNDNTNNKNHTGNPNVKSPSDVVADMYNDNVNNEHDNLNDGNETDNNKNNKDKDKDKDKTNNKNNANTKSNDNNNTNNNTNNNNTNTTNNHRSKHHSITIESKSEMANIGEHVPLKRNDN